MRTNLVKQRLLSGATVIGTLLQETRTPAMAQILKQTGFEYFMLDMEHGGYNLESVADLIRVGRLLDLCPLVRVVSGEYDWIARTLDQGAMGLMLPRVESRAQVEHFVACAQYPPLGKRGSAGGAHREYATVAVADFLAASNRETLLIIQIENRPALEQLDDLLTVPGVDVALVGPEDMSIALGIPGDMDHPALEDAMRRVVSACQRHGVVPGVFAASVPQARRWLGLGMRFLLYATDVLLYQEAARQALSQIKDET